MPRYRTNGPEARRGLTCRSPIGSRHAKDTRYTPTRGTDQPGPTCPRRVGQVRLVQAHRLRGRAGSEPARLPALRASHRTDALIERIESACRRGQLRGDGRRADLGRPARLRRRPSRTRRVSSARARRVGPRRGGRHRPGDDRRSSVVIVGAMDFRFIGASMGSVVGEKITRAFETRSRGAAAPSCSSAASGGARMQEGMLSLMQMAKTSAAAARLAEAGLPYVSILTNPTSVA